jgi:hypothetical protein
MKNTNRIILFICLILSLALQASAYRPKTFRIHVNANGDDTVSFAGWCDIEIGNRTLHRTEFEGSNGEMEPLVVYGRYIDNCEVTNLSDKGVMTFTLHAQDKEIYRKSTREGMTKIIYGPTMQRYSTQPPTMR